MNRIEALAIAIAREHQSFEPGSEALHNLNPGLLKSHSLHREESLDLNGMRIFSTFQGGYRALTVNLMAKCSGRTQANGVTGKPLTSVSTLGELCKTFRSINTRTVVEFLQDALDDKAINERTAIGFFLEGS